MVILASSNLEINDILAKLFKVIRFTINFYLVYNVIDLKNFAKLFGIVL